MTQREMLRRHLTTIGTITQVEAAALYKVRSLTKRIAELRDAGMRIESEWRRDMTGQRYVRYHHPVTINAAA